MKSFYILVASLLPFSIFAQEPIITDRPDQTESPNAVERGVLQIESGFLFERSVIADGFSQHRTAYPSNLFRIGLIQQLELRIVSEVVNYRTINNKTQKEIGTIAGMENLQVGLKYQLSQKESPLVTGILAHVVFPTGSNGISNEKYGIISKFCFSYTISENKSIGGNLGYTNQELRFGENKLLRDVDGDFTYTFVYGQGLSQKLGVYAEAFGSFVNFSNWETSMDMGMTYLIMPSLQLDYSFGWGVDHVMNYHSLGFSLKFN